MRKNNETDKITEVDFSSPIRQSPIALLLILLKTMRIIVRQLLPLVIILFFGTGIENSKNRLIFIIIAAAILTMIISVIRYFRTWFYLSDNQLILHTGVIQTKNMIIPYDRIQSINFSQNIIQRLTDVVELQIDTAGSSKDEFEFYALSKEKANILRSIIMSAKSTRTSHQNDIKPEYTKTTDQVIIHHHLNDLIKIGLAQNHIRSASFIIIILFWIQDSLSDIGIDVFEYSDDISHYNSGLSFWSFVLGAMISVGIIISVVRTILNFYDFKAIRHNKGFKLESGLFTKNEVSALDKKIQILSWHDNLIKKIFKFKDIYLKQASSSEVQLAKSIKLPGCDDIKFAKIQKFIFPKSQIEYARMRQNGKLYFVRFIILMTIGYLFICVGYAYTDLGTSFAIPTIIFLFIITNRYLSFRKYGYDYDENFLYIKGGKFGDTLQIIPIYKIQSLSTHDTPFMRRKNLTSINIYVASGRVVLPYISTLECRKLINYCLFNI